MKNIKKLTLLHSNDMHGDFHSEKLEGKTIGGVSHLSGYVKKIREKSKNSIYCISGDMLQGSLIDSEYRGISTIEIMNYLSPDVVSLGNHEIDYGLGHLLLLERCAKFPIVNANLFIKSPYTRLFKSHEFLHIDGMKIMFIGIITNEVLSPLKKDNVLGSLVDVEEAAREVGKISNAYKTVDIDLTVLLTHIGFEEDKKLASLLDPEWGIDLIIGGHSHTILDKPECVNDILIVQAGVGTNQIGKFELNIDTDTNTIDSYEWELVPIDANHCPADSEIEQVVRKFKDVTDAKYDRVMCTMKKKLTHPDRYRETELGNLMCDIIKDSLQLDIVMLGSGSIRKKEAGPILTLSDFRELMPYEEKLYQLKIKGSDFKKMYKYMLREEALTGNHTEFYQYSHGLAVEYDSKKKKFNHFNFLGKKMEDDTIYKVGMQGFHYTNFDEFFGLSVEEIIKNAKPVVVATSINDILEEYLAVTKDIDANVEERLVVL